MTKSFIIYLLALAALIAPTGSAAPAPAAPGIVSAHGRLQVAGNRIVGADGRPISLAGNSFFWSQWMGRFYTAETVAWLKRDWNSSLVRAALGIDGQDGYLRAPEQNLPRVTAVVDAAIANDMYVLIDWHDHRANEHADQSVAFFSEMARRYGNSPNVIYEIFNEPLADASWERDLKPYAEKVIAAIRAHDPDNLIVVGTPAWSQRVDLAAADPIKDPNVAYALHFYAGSHKADLRAKAEEALKLGAALMVTEWGVCNADGDGPIDEASVNEWMDFMRRNQLSHCNWAISDKRESASILRPGASEKGGWNDADLTPAGLLVRGLIRGWSR